MTNLSYKTTFGLMGIEKYIFGRGLSSNVLLLLSVVSSAPADLASDISQSIDLASVHESVQKSSNSNPERSVT